ncbi:MAG: FapA family protein [Lachnospiraceae bacterium]|nr:FapA family protein [Lachnospiraceae bacterium]
MSISNGYIQIFIKDQKAWSKYFPPSDGGRSMALSEASSYLSDHGVRNFDPEALEKQLMAPTASVIPLSDYYGPEFGELMTIKVSLDRMKVTVRFFPPSSGGDLLGPKEIIEELTNKGIVYGIDQDAIISFISDRHYNTEYILAKGDPPVTGRDARIIYNFNTNPSLRPKRLEDGSVDYKNLNTICSVKKGDLLAKLIPSEPGKAGKDVFGSTIPVREVKSFGLRYGKNISINDDGTEIYSDIDGHVVLDRDGTVIVSDELVVRSDVDNSTGNIDYDGNVQITGAVRSGFSVRATGDIVIDGVVEGAFIDAGGQIIARRGVHGMNKGLLQCKGNFMASYIENARIFSGGYVETGSILYSDVSASSDVMVMNHKGFIAGSTVRAGGKVESMTIGSEMGAATRVEVGINPEKKRQYGLLQKQILDETKQLDKVKPIVDSYEQFIKSGKSLDDKNRKYLSDIIARIEQLRNDLKEHREQFNALHQDLLMSQQSKVVVHKEIFPGVTITISDLSFTTTDKYSCVQFEQKNGEIKRNPVIS